MSQRTRAPDPAGPAARFESLYDHTYADLLRFVQRRVHESHAEDVVAEAFTVVWRRLADVPDEHDAARAYVFGIARNVLLNARRGAERHQALGVQLMDAAHVRAAHTDSDLDAAADLLDLSRAWARLSDIHQEALALSAIDGLNATEAAAVLDVSPVAFRLRLSRARRALRAHLSHLPARPSAPSRPVTERCANDASSR